jgi:hypothetical protein
MHTMRRSAADAPVLDRMVLTWAVGMTGSGHTRRRVLSGTAGVTLSAMTLAGCGLFGGDDDDTKKKAADPLTPVLNESLTLAAAYDRALVAQPGLKSRLTSLAADHRAHATALAKAIGEAVPSAAPGASSAAAAGDAAGLIAELRKSEQAAQKTAAAACKTTTAARAALVGSIAACRATHAEALR